MNKNSERYLLALGRIREMGNESTGWKEADIFFGKMSEWVLFVTDTARAVESGEADGWSLEKWQQVNRRLYEDILPENYGESYGRPGAAEKRLGKEYGGALGFLYCQLRGLIGYCFDGLEEAALIHMELLLEIYGCFLQKKGPDGVYEGPRPSDIKKIIYSFVSDNCAYLAAERARCGFENTGAAYDIVMNGDLSDPRILYRYGEYITDTQLELARFMNELPDGTIQKMADTFTEGYRMGFIKGGRDISVKKTVDVRYPVGFERMVRRAAENFRKMGLETVFYRPAMSIVNRRGTYRSGFCGEDPNPRFDQDHSEDMALYMDARFCERYLNAVEKAYENVADKASYHAGPALIETFGGEGVSPERDEAALSLSGKQQLLLARIRSGVSRTVNEFVPSEETSYTIIAFPTPKIGPMFPEIFEETVKINSLDSLLYEKMQQALIDELDKGRYVYIKGQAGNRTSLRVALKPLEDPGKQTCFENCTADVNIPVGEVFTSPRLEGTSGLLHVSGVYLDGVFYRNLWIRFEDGMTVDYGCEGFGSEKESRAALKANVLFHHEALPLGEFAIGTNTAAYVMGRKYGIEGKLPVLIAEKTGPHFAVGDTCYSFSEDIPVFNPDGKEIAARDNEISLKRKEDPEAAYFGCHTDITIPFEETGLIEVETPEGGRIPLIREGRFVLPSCLALNEPLGLLDKEN